MEQSKPPRSVLTNYVRTLQQSGRRPAAERDAAESLSRRRIHAPRNPLLTRNQHIVGRERELQLLRDSYDRVTTTEVTEVVTIHGPSGAGKSALVQAFVRTLPDGGFYYMEGKFNQLQTRAPYAALAAASDQLCRQIMRRENCIDIRDRIRAILGPDVSLLGSLVPTLAHMTTEDGSTDQHTVASGAQAFTRFKLLFRAFLRCVASPECPVVFFLDDLQWADVASLEVLKTLLNDGQSHCIMIACSYREGEMTVAQLERCGLAKNAEGSCRSSSLSFHSSRITDIGIDHLDCDSFNQLLCGTLRIDALATRSLSMVLWNKTDGNPFHALNFLNMLYQNGMLCRESDGSWTWDEEQILRGTNVAENLADILASRIQDLPEQVLSILQIASFIGYDFLAAALVMIVHEEQDLVEVDYSFERHSKEVIRERIVAALEIAVAQGLLETMPEADHFKFAHDKIQEVLYETLMPDETERQLLHQRIGTLIWDSLKGMAESQADDWNIFLAADNLNRALNLVDYSGSRYDLVELNLTAAKRAIEKAAFVAAADYLRIAVSLLQGDVLSWDNRYKLCIDVFTTAAETEKNTGMFSHSSALVKDILVRTRSFHDSATAYAVEMDSLALQGDLKGSIFLGLKVLRKLGVYFPRNINMLVVVNELIRAKLVMAKRSLPEFLFLPEMSDQTLILAFGFMNAIALNCYMAGGSFKATYAAISLRMFRLTLKFGICPLHSPGALFAWGSVHSALGKFDDSLLAEQLAFDIINKYDVESVRASALICNYGMNHFWRNMLDSGARSELLGAYHMALRYGHVFVAQTGFLAWMAAGLYLDDSMAESNAIARRVVQEMREFQTKSALVLLLPAWQVYLNICGDASNTNPASLTGEAVDDDFALEMQHLDSKVATLSVSFFRLLLGFVYEDWQAVKHNLPIAFKYRMEAEGYFTTGFFYTWIAACHYDIYYTEGISKHKREGRQAHRKVYKWATTGTEMLVGPNSFLHAMESLCVKKAPGTQVEIMFEKSASACAAGRCRFFEALSNERLARLFRHDETNTTKRSKYLRRAVELYRTWGAVAKAEWLEKQDEGIRPDL